jgi:excisionase family DNA binding protein
MEEYLTLDEVATMLKLSSSNLRRLAAEGDLPAIKVGRLWRLRLSQVETWLQARERERVPRGREAETRAWLEEGLEVAAQGIKAAEQNVPQEELQGWLTAMARAVTPLEAGHV